MISHNQKEGTVDLEIIQVTAGVFPILRYGDEMQAVVVRMDDYLHFVIRDDGYSVIHAAGRAANEYDVRIPVSEFQAAVERLASNSEDEYSTSEGTFSISSMERDERYIVYSPPCGDAGANVKLSVLKEIMSKFGDEPATAEIAASNG